VTAKDTLNALDTGRRRRSPECASDLVLDRLALGELGPGERPALEAHLAACSDCAQASARLAAERARFAAEAPIANLAADTFARSQKKEDADWRILWRRFFLPLGVVASMAVITVWQASRPNNRIKGDFTLSPYVMHPESAGGGATLHTGEPLHPGDKVQFHYNGGRPGHLAIVAVDEANKISVYYPPGPIAAAVESGKDVPLQSAVELDATLGHEVVIGVRCDGPLPVELVVNATRKAVAGARQRGAAATELGPLGLPCAETRYQIAKQARPGP
jgi:hypothetical protein